MKKIRINENFSSKELLYFLSFLLGFRQLTIKNLTDDKQVVRLLNKLSVQDKQHFWTIYYESVHQRQDFKILKSELETAIKKYKPHSNSKAYSLWTTALHSLDALGKIQNKKNKHE